MRRVFNDDDDMTESSTQEVVCAGQLRRTEHDTASDAMASPSSASRFRMPSRWPIALTLLCLFVARAHATYVEFTNCLSDSQQSDGSLKFVPFYVDATFDTSNPSHLLNLTAYGNVTGQALSGPREPYDSPRWNDPNYTMGKIINTDDRNPSNRTQSALDTSLNVLTYTAAEVPFMPFCNTTRGDTECPVGPVFFGNISDASTLRAFGISRELNASFRFTTIDADFRIIGAILDGNGHAQDVGCIAVSITPQLGSTIFGLLRYLPVAILVFVALATVSAAIISPWGTSNPFKWTSNYGRDEDLLRLVTPGFGDCLQYIQFIFLSGALSLNYPGYFRPVVSTVNWSALMFNQSFVLHADGVQNPRDGVYVTHADYYGADHWNNQPHFEKRDYGMTRLRQMTGLAADEDIWAGTVIWLLVIIAAVVILCQLFFFVRWLMRTVTNEPEEDLRSKNWPFTGGMLVRLVCNYFLLPLSTVSFFQLVIAVDSDAVVTVFAVILLVLLLAFAGWILKIIISAKPRSILFDDLQKVLLYGPLYNTYSDDAAPFALIPALVTFFRAVAIGAVQPSGIAQIVILAVCEVVLIITFFAFRPFRKQTSMNAYHTFFAVMRLLVVLLSVTFVPTLEVQPPTKSWIGYVILLLHAIVLVFGFLLNAIQTLVEVIARFSGAGADETTGAATRGTIVKVFGKRQLTRRRLRPGLRNSLTSDAMLTDDADALENKSAAYGGRSRSLSASSAILLNQRTSSHLDRTESASAGKETSAANSTYAALHDADAGPSARADVIRAEGGAAPFYRAPRQRRPTGDMMTPGQRSRASWVGAGAGAGAESPNAGNTSPDYDKRESVGTIGKAISTSPDAKTAPSASYLRRREGSDPTILNDPRRPDVDYAVREVDFYYNVRGPRLNDQPTRQLKTGPADPVGPVSSATGWFKTMLGRKSKDQSKGFEVVRSARAPPEQAEDEMSPEMEPYKDSPASPTEPAVLPGQRTRSNEEDRDQTLGGAEEASQRGDVERGPNSPLGSGYDGRDSADAEQGRRSQVSGSSDLVPSLAPIDAGSSIHVPSRFNSQSTHQGRSDFPLSSQREEDGEGPPLLAPIDAGSSIHMPSRFNSRATTVQRQASNAGQYGDAQDSGPRGTYEGELRPEGYVPQNIAYGAVTPTGRMPFSTPLSPIVASGRNSLGAESALSVDRELLANDGETMLHTVSGNLAVPVREERHSSTGEVQHYRIADRITQGTPDLEFSEGHEAELVDGGSRRSARSSTGIDRAL